MSESAAAQPNRLPASPFVGLQPFAESDRAFFFGRESESETIGANLISSPLTLFYGASGVGKSSVLSAGVVPYLRAQPDVAVVNFKTWPDRTFRSILMAAIARELEAVTGQALTLDTAVPFDEFLSRAANAARRTLLLILDQFEEYFLYHSQDEAFDQELARAVNREEVHANFLLSLREDALSRLDRFEGRIPNLYGNYLRLEHLTIAGARLAIKKPLEVYNGLRPGQTPFDIEDPLVDLLVEDVRAGRVTLAQVGQGTVREGAVPPSEEGRIEAPFLQMILTRLWNEEVGKDAVPLSYSLRLSTYQRLGGAQKIVSTYLDELMDRLSPGEQEIASLFFDRLVTPTGNKIAQTSDDLARYAKRDAPEILPILKVLDDGRVLRRIPPPLDQPTALRYELFHDVLAPAVLAWQQRYLAKKAEEQGRQEEQARHVQARRRLIGRIQAGIVAVVFVCLCLTACLFLAAYSGANDLQTTSSAREFAFQSLNNIQTDPERSILIALQSLQTKETPEGEDALRQALLNSLMRLTLRTDGAVLHSAAFSPDGRRIVTAATDDTARLWDASTGQELLVLRGHTDWVNRAAFSPDGNRIVTASGDKTARIWDAATGRELTTLSGHTGGLWSAAFSRDGTQVVTTADDKTVRIWDSRTGTLLQTLRASPDTVFYAAEFSPDDKRIATASQDKLARIWDLGSGKPIKVFSGHDSEVYGVQFSPDGKRIVTASRDGTARIWDVATTAEVTRLEGHSNTVWDAAFSPDGRLIATSSFDFTSGVWDAATGKELVVLRGHTNSVRTAVFSPDQNRIVTASEDGTARVWDWNGGAEVALLRGHTDTVTQAAFSPDGKALVTASRDETARIWNTATWSTAQVLTGHVGALNGALFSPDGKLIVTTGDDKTARLWEAETGHLLGVLSGHTDSVQGAAFSPDGRLLATASQDKTVRIWDVASHSQLQVLSVQDDPLYGVAFSPDGKLLAASGGCDTCPNLVYIWETATWGRVRNLPGHSDLVWSVAFSPTGSEIVTASRDGTVRVWSAATGSPSHVLRGHVGGVEYAVFSPDGKHVLSAGLDRTARIWDAASGSLLETLHGHSKDLWSAVYSPDGKYIATASADATVRIYLANLSDLLTLARTRVTRSLTCDERVQFLHEPPCPTPTPLPTFIPSVTPVK